MAWSRARRRTQRVGAERDPRVAVPLRILRVPKPAHAARRGARGEARREGPETPVAWRELRVVAARPQRFARVLGDMEALHRHQGLFSRP